MNQYSFIHRVLFLYRRRKREEMNTSRVLPCLLEFRSQILASFHQLDNDSNMLIDQNEQKEKQLFSLSHIRLQIISNTLQCDSVVQKKAGFGLMSGMSEEVVLSFEYHLEKRFMVMSWINNMTDVQQRRTSSTRVFY